MNFEWIARICHESNKAFCEVNGDYSQVPWNTAPMWVRESAVNGVKFVYDHQYDDDFGPSAQHDAWMADKIANGWKYGDVKDPAKKEHPCIVPFEDLDTNQQLKDELFQAVANVFIPYL